MARRIGEFSHGTQEMIQTLNPLEYVERVWSDEKWTLGGYAAQLPPGAFFDGFRLLRAPEDVLHWAGTELATSWPGYMEGAIESGERSAQEILEASSIDDRDRE